MGQDSFRGRYFHRRRHCALRSDALDRASPFPPRGYRVNAIYIVSGVLALCLCVYLLYAMFKPEKF